MSETTEVRCDNCNADLTYTGNSVDYRVLLTSESKAPWFTKEGKSSGAVTDMMIWPPIKGRKHFCAMRCLFDWMLRENPDLLAEVSR